MAVTIELNGKVIHRSHNLRGLITHAHCVGVSSVLVLRSESGVFVSVGYQDGSWCRTNFADFTVARDFFRKRWQKWGLSAEVRCSDNHWSFQ